MHNALDIICVMHTESISIRDRITRKLELLTEHRIVSAEEDVRISNIGTIDFVFKDDHGNRYFAEVKRGRITAFDVGRIVRSAERTYDMFPSSKFFVFVDKIDPTSKKVLDKMKINVVVLKRLPQLSNERRSSSTVQVKSGKLQLSPREQEAYFLLQRRGIKVATPETLAEELKISAVYARNLLASLARSGVLSRFGRGKYVVLSADIVYHHRGYTTDPLSILDQLFGDEPYYAAYATALYIHGLSHQIPFQTQVATIRQKRSMRVGNSLIKFVKISPLELFGYEERRYLDSFVKVSDIEKTIIDCIQRPDLCGGISEVTRSMAEALGRIDVDKFLSYISKIANEAAIQRLGFILAKLRFEKYEVDSRLLKELKNRKFRHRHLLDFTQPKKGKFSKEWKIIENVNCMSWKYD